MKVAVVGAGLMGGRHAEILASMDEVQRLYVVDADADRAADIAQRTGASAVGLERAVAEADALVVATPAQFHDSGVRAAIEAGRPVLCEKPLTADLASSVALVALAEERDAHVEVGFQRRHDPGFVAARRRVADGTVGRINLLRLTAFDPRIVERPPPTGAATETAPIFLDSSVHDFDFARWMTGSEIVELTASGTHRGGVRPDDPREIETAVVSMLTADGTLVGLEATWLHPGGYDSRVEIVGDLAHLTVGLDDRTPAEHLDWPDAVRAGGWTGFLERYTPAYRAELVAFLAAVRGEQPPATTARDGLEAMRIAVAATRSFVERRSVTLAEI